MAIMSTVTESCSFLNGVGGCTIFGEPSQAHPIQPPSSIAPLPTPFPTASTPAGSASSPTPQSASPSLTLSLPSSTPLSASPTAVAPSNVPNTPPSSSNTPSQWPINTPSTGITDTRSDTNTLATGFLSATTPSPSSSTSPIPLLPSSSPSTSRLSAGAIAAIGISAGGILLVLVLGIIWYAMRRRRRAPPVVISSAALGSNVSLSESALIPTTQHGARVSTEDEGDKLEYNAQSSFTRQDTTRRGSVVAQVSNFMSLSRSCERNPLSRFLETVPFLSPPSMSAKAAREAARIRTTTRTALSPSPWSVQATEGSQQSAAEMGDGAPSPGQGHRDLWECDEHREREDRSRSRDRGGTFRYETDGGVCLDGGPLEEPRYAYADDEQRTSVATVVTLPPPYSQY